MHRIFLLSPASCVGARARLMMNATAQFDLARRLRTSGGAPLGEVFSFLSGLYFRGKLIYALRYARPPARQAGVYVITSSAGLCAAEEPITIEQLRSFADVPIDVREPRYVGPLLRDAGALAAALGRQAEAVLLGSVATGKYVEPLLSVFAGRLRLPREFVGRGDMSRGGLLLRCVESRRELEYVPVHGAVRHGPRPAKLIPRRRSAAGRGRFVA